jgi:ferredoxin
MTYLVTENCVNCKFTDCVEVCPVDAFHEGDNFLAINPDECIDCNVCVPACPTNAIIADDEEDHPDFKHWLDLNRRVAMHWPVITVKKDPLPDAEAWDGKPNKKNLVKE